MTITKNQLSKFFGVAGLALIPFLVFSAEPRDNLLGQPTADLRGIFCLIVFFVSYLFVITEEKTQLRKSKPVMLGAGIIWIVIGWMATDYNIDRDQLHDAIFHDLDEYASLMLFLLAAMTYISVLENTNVFASLRAWLVNKGLNYRQLFWATGLITFFLSPIADNLTTSLVMGSVVLAIGANNPKFIGIAMVNIVCAANAGGAFSPFGDITTLMVWQAGKLEFAQFLVLFLPALVNYVVPALVMNFFIPNHSPAPIKEQVNLHRGARRVIGLGILTIIMAVSFEQLLGLPPFMGMMIGMSFLMFQTYFLRKSRKEGEPNYDIFEAVKSAEWDTLFFFFGVIFSVGGLAFMGYMTLASEAMYGNLGPTTTNSILGLFSAVIDNIPVMFSVLSMQPQMDSSQWLLITLTCGVGGSLMSIGSAAGVALMGTSKGKYTFMVHLKWAPVIFLGYASSIGVHLMLNS
ncbi:sodium:proton antiporter NhaD [Marinicella sp. W31]|uniref:sodium:proton antiporter NhaD n=1 Tax=Marinicella sp. W31 TaxID=3023713 RepID=UPI0037579786